MPRNQIAPKNPPVNQTFSLFIIAVWDGDDQGDKTTQVFLTRQQSLKVQFLIVFVDRSLIMVIQEAQEMLRTYWPHLRGQSNKEIVFEIDVPDENGGIMRVGIPDEPWIQIREQCSKVFVRFNTSTLQRGIAQSSGSTSGPGSTIVPSTRRPNYVQAATGGDEDEEEREEVPVNSPEKTPKRRYRKRKHLENVRTLAYQTTSSARRRTERGNPRTRCEFISHLQEISDIVGIPCSYSS